jgi:DNA polymerase-3 subunit alpha
MGLNIKNPNINTSERRFSLDESKNIVYGLGLVKGVGSSAVESIMELRPFNSFEDFI